MKPNCPECATEMNKSQGWMHAKYICPACGHIVRKFVGNKKAHSVRLYPYQKKIADKRGGVQFVVDTVLQEDDE